MGECKPVGLCLRGHNKAEENDDDGGGHREGSGHRLQDGLERVDIRLARAFRNVCQSESGGLEG